MIAEMWPPKAKSLYGGPFAAHRAWRQGLHEVHPVVFQAMGASLSLGARPSAAVDAAGVEAVLVAVGNAWSAATHTGLADTGLTGWLQ